MKILYPCHRFVHFAKPLAFTFLSFFFLFQPSAYAQVSGISKMNIKLLLNTNGGSVNTADGCTIMYGKNFLQGIGPEDSYKFTNLDENLASPCANKLLSIDGRPSSIASNDTIALKIWQYRHADYYLKFEATNFPAGVIAVLKDNYLQQDQDIRLDSTTLINYTLTSDTLSAASNRFCIVLKPAGTLALDMLSLSATAKENRAIIAWSMNAENSIAQYEIERSANAVTFTKAAAVAAFNGQQAGQQHQWTDNETQHGNIFYRIKTVRKSGETSYSKVLKVNMTQTLEGISVYPNPAHGNAIGLQLSMEKCNGTVTIYNSNAQPVFMATINHPGNTSGSMISLNGKTLPKGNYTLIFSNGNKNFSKTLLID